MSDVEVVVVDDPARLAAEHLAAAAAAGAAVALSGGSTPGPAYRLAARLEPDWSRAHLWFADERCVPPDDDRSNARLVEEMLLAHVAARPVVHRIRGELPPAEAAVAYDRELDGVVLDLVLLGLGSDGHTASLFPGSPALAEEERDAVAAEPGLEPWVPRVTLTPRAIARAALALYLVTGEEKAAAAGRAFAGPPAPDVPAGTVRARRTVALLDPAAASRLHS